jgi:hypothetical protein
MIFGKTVQHFALLDDSQQRLLTLRFIYRQEIKGSRPTNAAWQRDICWQLKCPNPRHYEHFGIHNYAL